MDCQLISIQGTAMLLWSDTRDVYYTDCCKLWELGYHVITFPEQVVYQKALQMYKTIHGDAPD